MSKVLWEHHSIEKFLSIKKKNKLRLRGQEGIKIKICFSRIKDLHESYFSNRTIFLSQNSYGYNKTEANRSEVSEAVHKVASIWLKIVEQVAYG